MWPADDMIAHARQLIADERRGRRAEGSTEQNGLPKEVDKQLTRSLCRPIERTIVQQHAAERLVNETKRLNAGGVQL